MKLKEYQGKKLFKEYEIPIPKGEVVSDAGNLPDLGVTSYVVKSQLLIGSRKKQGGILFASKDELKDSVNELLGKEIAGLSVTEVLVEEKLAIENELYLALTIDRFCKCVKVLYSPNGGIDIEENPDEVLQFDVGEKIETVYAIQPLLDQMYRLMQEKDAELVEINPLVVVGVDLFAADSKVILDDNALFRHPEYKEVKEDVQYVKLDGDIAVIGNGAGLVMATLDVLGHFGGKAADFLDIGGGANVLKMEKAMEKVLLEKPKALLINIFGGITRCDLIAQGIVNYRKNKGVDVPMVVRLIGMHEKEGKKILQEHGIDSLDSMEACVKKVIEVAQ